MWSASHLVWPQWPIGMATESLKSQAEEAGGAMVSDETTPPPGCRLLPPLSSRRGSRVEGAMLTNQTNPACRCPVSKASSRQEGSSEYS